ncbi:hypothetical protein Catovirus_1_878 [Catovirus CTV1]|uniref:Uncharacterized protein n=1 Tax=Catovirus CTV1 TaxID=1977631 RepID=A0A1V0SAZ9_9VIRU|nr:hypothetical protein Catovirus_1_878 [Catovirus CTV1]
MINIILITLLILFLMLYCLYYSKKYESFWIDETKPKILDDKLFDDVTTYENDEDGRLGLDKCIAANCGVCLEYGLTGNALCFPKKEPLGKNYNTVDLNWNKIPKNVDL